MSAVAETTMNQLESYEAEIDTDDDIEANYEASAYIYIYRLPA